MLSTFIKSFVYQLAWTIFEWPFKTGFTVRFRKCRILETGHLSIILANSLDPDRVRQNVGPDLDPSCLSVMILMKECFESLFFERSA